jgi:hypothetical protein
MNSCVNITRAGTWVDKSGTIATGGAAQTAVPENLARSYLFIQNNSAGDLWFNAGVTAVASQPSIKLVAGASIAYDASFVPRTLISIIGATTAQTFTIKEA